MVPAKDTFFADVFPARAGMIPPPNASVSTRKRIPRESGDDPESVDCLINEIWYSPRERG